MNTRYQYIFIVLLLFLGGNAMAQQKGFVSFGWQMGLTMGDTKDYCDDFSFEGGHFGVERFVTPEISLGLDFNFSHFYEESGKIIYQTSNATYSGSGYQYYDSSPVLVTGKYYWGADRADAKLLPYIGVSTGIYFVKERLEVGSVAFEDSDWVFGVAPRAGIMFRLDQKAWLFTDIAYNSLFERKDIDSHTYTTGTIGVKISF